QDLKELMHDSQSLIENFYTFAYIEIVGGFSIKRLKFRIVPEELWRVQNFRMKVDEVTLNKKLSHLLRNLFSRKRDLSFDGKFRGKVLCCIDGLLDHLFKGGQLYRLRQPVRYRKLGQRIFILKKDFIFLNAHIIAKGKRKLIELDLRIRFFLIFFNRG